MESTARYEDVWAFENLLRAHKKAMLGKRSRPDIATFEYNREHQLIHLRDDLAQQRYRPGAYRRYRIDDPKPRLISAAPFRDRVVHHALCNIIEPIFERRFIADSYASRRGKGIHDAIDCCTAFARRLRGMARAYEQKEIDFETVKTKVMAWIAHGKHGDTYHLRSDLFEHITFRH